MVVRNDIGLESIGTMAELPPDHSPLQIGASGECRNQHFKLLGRLRVRWAEGAWDEWYADFGDNRHGWVAETQGFFLISEEMPPGPAVAEQLREAVPGTGLVIGEARFQVSDIKQATAVGGAGELPFVAVPGTTWQGMDLTGPGRQFAGLEWHGDEPRFFMGFSAIPGEIRWQGLRPVPGWNGEPVPVEKQLTQTLNCPQCGGVVELRHAGLTITLSCGHCGCLIDVHEPHAQAGQKVLKSKKLGAPPLPLGQRGFLDGVEWEILGCLWRKDPYVSWRELLLFNPWHGFSWLTESAGHWNFVKRIPDIPSGNHSKQRFEGRDYSLFDAQTTEVIQVAGEFYWRVRAGEKADVADYIAPPYVLSSETYPELEESTWSAGRYLPADEVGNAFGKPLTQGGGVYLNAPNPWQHRRKGLAKLGVFALLAAVGLEMLSSSFLGRRTAINENLTTPTAEAVPGAAVSQAFRLSGGRRSEIVMKTLDRSALDNLSPLLVNERTGATYTVTMPDASGIADAASRSEVITSVSGLPAGKYHIALNPLPGASLPASPVHVTVRQGGLFVSNFVICLLAILCWPAWAIYRYHRFEAQRWSQSDYTP